MWAPDYLTVEEAADYIQIDDDADDAELAVAIGAASRAIDAACNRQFGKVGTAEERRYRACGRVVDIDDLFSAGDLTVTDTDGNALTGFELGPFNALAKGRPYTRIILGASVTGQVRITSPSWGWSAVPSGVAMAARIQVHRFHKRRESPFGVTGSPSQGGELRLLARLDPDVAVSLRAFRRPRKVG